jgi:hypothetical protein
MEANWKYAVGKYKIWHVGYMEYEVRNGDQVMGKAKNLMNASALASQLYKEDKAHAEQMRQEHKDLLDDWNWVGSRHHY